MVIAILCDFHEIWEVFRYSALSKALLKSLNHGKLGLSMLSTAHHQTFSFEFVIVNCFEDLFEVNEIFVEIVYWSKLRDRVM